MQLLQMDLGALLIQEEYGFSAEKAVMQIQKILICNPFLLLNKVFYASVVRSIQTSEPKRIIGAGAVSKDSM